MVACRELTSHRPRHAAMEVRSAVYGHQATFHTDRDCTHHADLVEWGPREIAVPSGSALDCRADVCLSNIRTTEASARAWCARVGASFISCNYHQLSFSVRGFSRYRYIDSDSETDDDEPAGADEVQISRRPPQRRGSAGRTPHRRKLNADMREHSPFPALQFGDSASAEVHGRLSGAPRRNPKDEFRPTIADANDEGDFMDSGRQEGRRSRVFGLPLDDDDDDDVDKVDNEDGEVRARKIEPFSTFSPWATRSDPNVTSALFADFAKTHDSRYDSESVQDEDELMQDITPAKHSARHVRFAHPTRKKRPEGIPFRPLDPDDDMVDSVEKSDNQLLAGTKTGITGGSFPVLALPFPELAASVSVGQEGNFADLNHALGRSFRLGFKGAASVVKPVYAQTSNRHYSSRGFVASVEPIFVHGRGRLERLHFIDMLRVHCSTWKTEELSPSNPDGKLEKMEFEEQQMNHHQRRVKIPTLVDAFGNPYVVDAVFDQIVDEIAILAEDHPNAIHGHVLFGLLRALYKQNQKAGAAGSENLIARLADWARGPAGTAFDEPIPEQPSLKKALLLMSIGDIEGAVEAATNDGHVRLALLMSRALEVPKTDLRDDAAAQLDAYCLREQNDNSIDMRDSEPLNGEEYQTSILENCDGNESVSLDERMILLLLAGRIPPVAQYLGLSWYRVFIMELLHGAGSSALSQPERVCAAVERIESSGISTIAPHRKSGDIDSAFHLLKLYADPAASYPVYSGVYSSRSVGLIYSPLDGRMPWFFHQLLSALVPVATTPRASWQLAESFAAQLHACGLPLWGFYVLCSGNPPESMLKQTLIRQWPELSVDFVEWCPDGESVVTQGSDAGETEESEKPTSSGNMQAEQFLVSVLGVPMEWIHEARAISCHVSGDAINEGIHWIATKTEEGFNQAHAVLTMDVFPKAISMYDTDLLIQVKKLLESLTEQTNIAHWSARGGLVLDYLKHVCDVPNTIFPDMTLLRSMGRRVAMFAEQASTPILKHAVTVIADGILAAQRGAVMLAEGDRDVLMNQTMAEMKSLPASTRSKRRTIREFKLEMEKGAAVASRLSASLPLYSKFIAGRSQ